jgi:hypothetical protein
MAVHRFDPWVAAAASVLALACAPDSSPPNDSGAPDGGGWHDAGHPDAGAAHDAGIGDAGAPPDGGSPLDAGLDGGPVDGGSTDAGLVFGTPITAPPNTWTWVPFPDSSCNDGTSVGIGINPSPTGSNLLVYLNGGGACWDAFTCLVVKSATLGPYTSTQFSKDIAGIGATVDRADSLNPFKDWSFVFVPYCTGDVHAGNNVATYLSGGQSVPFHHQGHANFMAYLARVAPTFPAPGKVMIVGDSAGGAGATVSYASARAYWPNATMYLINDSLPFYPPSQTPKATMTSELANWGIQPLLDEVCQGTCTSDFSQVYAALHQRFPSDRMAYLGYEQDQTMSAYYETLPQVFQLYLNQLSTNALHPSHFQTYLLDGANHTMLWSWASANTDAGVNLRTWVGQMVTDDSKWTSAGP